MYNQKLYYQYLIILGICVFVIIFYFSGGEFEFSTFGTAFSAVGITLLLDMLVLKTVVWNRFPEIFYIMRITKTPFLGGEWEGILESDHIFPKSGESIPPISANLKIQHKFD